MNKKLLSISLTAGMMLITFSVMAQGPPPGVPLDGVAGVLLAAGATYGAVKIYNSKFRSKKD